jgi:predicted ArsR family transcriptional regulator
VTKRHLSARSRLIIELRHARGISAVSIAGELGTTVQRVQEHIDRLEARRKAKEHFGGREYELRGRYFVRVK